MWKIIVVYRFRWLFYRKLKREEIFSSIFHRRGRFNWTVACIRIWLLKTFWIECEGWGEMRETESTHSRGTGSFECWVRVRGWRKYENCKGEKNVSSSTQHWEIHLRSRFDEGVFLFSSLLLLICYFFLSLLTTGSGEACIIRESSVVIFNF